MKITSAERQSTDCLAYLSKLLQDGGPLPSEYQSLHAALDSLYKGVQSGVIELEDVHSIWNAIPREEQLQSMIGFCFAKPHGYAGDFEVIERIYDQWTSATPKWQRWDAFFHLQKVVIAVRNRKEYFKSLMANLELQRRSLNILNLGSGPARDLAEHLQAAPHSQLRFTCVNQDPNALNFAKIRCSEFSDKVRFTTENVIRFQSLERYDVIWSAGLFDNFNDRLFVAVLARLSRYLKPGGKLVIGNFNTENPSRAFMELFGDWCLHHRSASQLKELLQSAGLQPSTINVEAEPEGVNLFAHGSF